MTNRPVMVERWTVVLLDVPRPIRSVVVVRGLRRAVEAVKKRPVRALLLAVRAMVARLRSGPWPMCEHCAWSD